MVESTLERPLIICGKGYTRQEFKDECDINVLMKKYETKGILPEMINQNPVYGDFSKSISYHEAHEIVVKADEQFKALSAELRDRFDNKPENFLKFCENPENAKEMIALGLAVEIKTEAVNVPDEQPKV